MKERRWEHHIVSGIPKLWVILSIEVECVSHSDEPESSEDQGSEPEVEEESGVVEGTVCYSHESGEDWSHYTEGLIDGHPEIVHYSEGSVEGVLTVLTRANLQSFEYSTYETTTLTESLINEVLYGADVSQEPCLKTG